MAGRGQRFADQLGAGLGALDVVGDDGVGQRGQLLADEHDLRGVAREHDDARGVDAVEHVPGDGARHATRRREMFSPVICVSGE